MSESLYDLLEVSANASIDEIENAYQRIVSYLDTSSLAIYSMMEEDEVAKMRSAVDAAFRTLSDPERRAAYDRALSEGDDYFPVIVPDVQTDSNVSIGRVGGEQRDRPRELEATGRTAEVPPPTAEAPAPAAPAQSEPLPRNPEPPAPPKPPPVQRLTPTLEIDVGPDTEFSGGLLQRLRESAGASLKELGEITKISKRYLQAIEENDFGALPAPVYVRGFVSEYARALGLDGQVVAKSYMALYQRYKQEGAK